MRLSRPSVRAFGISLLLVVLGLAGRYAGLSLTAPYSFVLVLLGYVLLALAVVMKGL